MNERPFLVPPGKHLFDFQIESVEKMIKFLKGTESKSVYQCSEMGVGKSVMAVATANALNFKRILVVSPASMTLTWEKEFNFWGTTPRKIHVILSGKTAIPKDAEIIICSDSLVWREKILKELSKREFDCLIADEFHRFKSRSTKRTKAVLAKLWPKSKYHIGLSGTPFSVRIIDGFTAFNRMLPSEFPDFWSFAYEYSFVERTRFGHNFYGVKNAAKLSGILRTNFYIRYKKEDVLKDLPPKVFQNIILPPEYSVAPKKTDKEQLQIDLHNVKKVIEQDKVPVVPATLAEHRKLQGEKKLPPIIEFIQDKVENKIPLVVFAWHKSVIEQMKASFDNLNPAVITGASSAKERFEAVRRFQEGETDLFIGNIQAAGVGITLTRASNVVMAEISWAPADNAQAVDRLARIGQKFSVTVYTFIVKDSLDETIHSTVMNRSRVFSKVLDPGADK